MLLKDERGIPDQIIHQDFDKAHRIGPKITTKHETNHIIAISESGIKINNIPINNISIENYSYEHIPTEFSAGGVMLYIGNHLNYKIRKDLSIYKAKELESIFIEIIFPKNIKYHCRLYL